MKYTHAIILTLAVLLSGGAGYSAGTVNPYPNLARPADSLNNNTQIVISNITTKIAGTVEPEPQKPSYIPVLRPYEIDKSHDIWHARSPSSYIMPDNEWVRYYASQLYVDNDGRIKYKNKPIPLLVNETGKVLYWTDEPFINHYIPLKEYFGVELTNIDYWMMTDYYLANGQRGICSGWALAVTSMMLSGEMSINKDGKFIKQIIPAKAIIGYAGLTRDVWVEYQVFNNTWITSAALEKDGYGNKISTTIFVEKDSQFKSVFEFTNIYFRMV